MALRGKSAGVLITSDRHELMNVIALRNTSLNDSLARGQCMRAGAVSRSMPDVIRRQPRGECRRLWLSAACRAGLLNASKSGDAPLMTTWDLKMRDPSEDLPLQKENRDVKLAVGGMVSGVQGEGETGTRGKQTEITNIELRQTHHGENARKLRKAVMVVLNTQEASSQPLTAGRQRGRRSTADLRSLVQNVRQELTEQVRAVERRLEGIEQDIGTGGISAKGTLTRSGDLKANDFCCDEEAHAIDLGRSLQEQEERVLRLVGHMVEHLITSETREARMIREAAGVESRTRPPQGQLENTPQSSRPGHQLTCERPSSLDDLRKSIDNLRTLAGRNTTEVCSTAAETAIGAPFLNRETRSDFSPDGAVGGAHLKGCYPADGIRVSQSRLADEKAPPGEDGDDPPHEVDTDLADLLKMRARLEEQLQWMDS
ncbi:hypothetical protein FOZ60_003692 [Perkinsus olseni]|uniref:Uncharacterized protein n=1 Tax=Perkinsus olseni TaxID=32597 RepID=A0A7J6PJE1_PEROL|nr:hypothetical protein FOZ60_003692 [Perkinsus olseni]